MTSWNQKTEQLIFICGPLNPLLLPKDAYGMLVDPQIYGQK